VSVRPAGDPAPGEGAVPGAEAAPGEEAAPAPGGQERLLAAVEAVLIVSDAPVTTRATTHQIIAASTEAGANSRGGRRRSGATSTLPHQPSANR